MPQHVVVETDCGKLRGVAEGGVNVFKGIPYAASPEGDGRFAAPRRLQPWTGVRDAFDFGNRAMQDENAFALPPAMLKLFAGRELPPMSENCLVLNVWTPAVNDGRKRPVMFWCHGGAFISGSGDSPWYDGTNLCRKGDVVVVTINHRLGAFGYLHLAEFGGEGFGASGNAGMLDIVAALEWVRDNIAAFGGDAGNVTIFGESGGGAKVSVLMAMPTAHGLFHKAIIQSGPAVQMASRDDASETARQILAELNLSPGNVSELLKVPAVKLAQAQAAVLKKVSMMSFANRRRVGFNPVIDGKYLPGGPFAPTAPAISANVPLMIGTNKDEMTLFFAFAPWLDGLDEAAMRKRVQMFVGDQ
ncbi:carboxylesterase/lipase family protein, partial [Candidatus Binatus sp.]|uniref:carboxylesterase/lipase family protein n=1 Tax=Candidatus Binatus sp. TaxID=2811406 RepID=UPI003CBB5EBB